MNEVYIAVDIEADGPIPGPYSMLSFGMVEVGNTDNNFYAELKPISNRWVPKAMEVNGLDRDKLTREGLWPKEAMQQAFDWITSIKNNDKRPVFLAGPAVWDGMFIHWYFINFIEKNPFGVTGSGIDLRTYWMGMHDLTWGGSQKKNMKKQLKVKMPHTHNALDDAKELAVLFGRILESQRND